MNKEYHEPLFELKKSADQRQQLRDTYAETMDPQELTLLDEVISKANKFDLLSIDMEHRLGISPSVSVVLEITPESTTNIMRQINGVYIEEVIQKEYDCIMAALASGRIA